MITPDSSPPKIVSPSGHSAKSVTFATRMERVGGSKTATLVSPQSEMID